MLVIFIFLMKSHFSTALAFSRLPEASFSSSCTVPTKNKRCKPDTQNQQPWKWSKVFASPLYVQTQNNECSQYWRKRSQWCRLFVFEHFSGRSETWRRRTKIWAISVFSLLPVVTSAVHDGVVAGVVQAVAGLTRRDAEGAAQVMVSAAPGEK